MPSKRFKKLLESVLGPERDDVQTMTEVPATRPSFTGRRGRGKSLRRSKTAGRRRT